MALKSTIYKSEIQIANMDSNYYETHNRTLAQHPSETEERLLVRIIAFILNASETLSFAKGISTDDEPDLWQKNYSDEIELWIELGQPDEKRIKKACSRSKKVTIYCYSSNSANVWWQSNKSKLQRYNNLSVIRLDKLCDTPYENLIQRNVQLQATIQDSQLLLTNGQETLEIGQTIWK